MVEPKSSPDSDPIKKKEEQTDKVVNSSLSTKELKMDFYRLRLIGLVLIYLLVANLSLVHKLKFLNQFDMGINLDFWEENTIFLSSIVFLV